MSTTALVIVSVLVILWLASVSVSFLLTAKRILGRVGEAPADLRGLVRAGAAREASHAILRVGLVAVLLDVVVDDELEWAGPVAIVSGSLFLAALVWDMVADYKTGGDPRVRHRTRLDSRREEETSDEPGWTSQPYEDPGWLPALKRSYLLGRTERGELDGVSVTRLLFGAFLLSALLILFVLTFVIDRVGTPSAGPASLVVGLGALGIAAASWTTKRKLDTTDARSVAESYRSNLLLGIALNVGALLMSFVLCFIEGQLWPCLVELPFYLIGMALVAPGRRNLSRHQEQISAQGSTVSLGRALSGIR